MSTPQDHVKQPASVTGKLDDGKLLVVYFKEDHSFEKHLQFVGTHLKLDISEDLESVSNILGIRCSQKVLYYANLDCKGRYLNTSDVLAKDRLLKAICLDPGVKSAWPMEWEEEIVNITNTRHPVSWEHLPHKRQVGWRIVWINGVVEKLKSDRVQVMRVQDSDPSFWRPVHYHTPSAGPVSDSYLYDFLERPWVAYVEPARAIDLQ